MLIERTREKRKESLWTKLGGFLTTIAKGIEFFADELQYETIEKEIKEVKHE